MALVPKRPGAKGNHLSVKSVQLLPMRLWRQWRLGWLVLTLAIYLLLTSYQLGLPGLHYDEAREAGLNAMELLTGAPVTAFRAITFSVGQYQFPVMVQDYIGALNVYLALPVLWASGIGVPNLRLAAILTGLLTLLLLERALAQWMALLKPATATTAHLPLSLPGLIAITLLAASPSFVFWSRQGIFVTNLTQPLTFWCIGQALCWLRTGQRRSLLWSAFAGGCALYAKLLAIWIIGPFVLLAGGWWFWQRGRKQAVPPLPWALCVGMGLAFLLPLLPVLFFNWQSGGTWDALTGNLGTSYYGVENGAIVANIGVRARQLLQTLQGSHLWYLGGLASNDVAPWLAVGSLFLGVWRRPRWLRGPLLLLVVAWLCSLFTLSDLFITHYALLQPLLIAVIALALAALFDSRLARRHLSRLALIALIVLWVAADLVATVRYHTALTRTGGLGDHSDVTYHLAYALRYQGLGAPIALDWGFDAPVRYLSEGTVTPIEIFGYAAPTTPDADFAARLQLFLGNPDNVYLLHTPAATVFQGRREQFLAAVRAAGLHAQVESTFAQRDGTPVIELWRVLPP